MEAAVAKPPLNELYDFISQVNAYPISVQQLLELAQNLKAPRPVIDFYQSFGRSLVFRDKDELIGRSEQVDIMRQEEQDMPRDGLSVPGED